MRIGLDLDNVLGDELTALVAWHNLMYKTSLSREDFVVHKFWEVWGGTYEDAVQKMRAFSDTRYFTDMQPVDGSQAAVMRLKEKHELHVITSRPDYLLQPTIDWVERYFPKAFTSLTLCNHYSMTGTPKKKLEVCDDLHLDWYVDDDADLARECLAPERRILLFRQPWSTRAILPQGMFLVRSWEEAYRLLDNNF
jgi:uncharacterized HAD superfamily protein